MVESSHICVVSGEAGAARLLRLRLEEAGYRVHLSMTGKDFFLSLADVAPSAVVFSLDLPDMGPVEFYRLLSARASGADLPVIVIADSPRRTKNLPFPPQNILIKPYELSALRVLVQEAVSKKRAVTLPEERSSVREEPRSGPPTHDPAVKAAVLKVETVPAKVNLKELTVSPDVIAKVPARLIWHYKFFPVSLQDDLLTVATNRPQNRALRDDLRQYLGLKITTVFAEQADIDEAINKYCGVGGETIDKIFSGSSLESMRDAIPIDGDSEDIAKLAEDASVIKLVNQILLEANEKNASDIHVEPYQGKLKLRYRVDGVLVDVKVADNFVYFLPAIISRIKIMSGLNIVERRLPQDGRAKVNIKNEKFDLRVSVVPTVYGESVVIRILPSHMLFSLEKLGLSEKDTKSLEELIVRPHGMIFVTGPTGSGKTTTLYAILTKIKAENVGAKIITIEDPVEYQLEGITQVQVNPDIDFTFAKALRSFLRHDPDIMMVGEVRDYETAEVAIRMALTGHLLFSTLHTNDAASGVARLADMGIEPYLLSSSVIGFMAQRLVRTICPACKEEVTKSEKVIQEIALLRNKISEIREQRENDGDAVEFARGPQSVQGWLRKGEKCYHGKGCEACNFSGYKGRTSIFELLMVTESIQELILKKAAADQIKRAAIAQGMRTLYQHGFDKVVQGVTSFEEILRVVESGEENMSA